MANQSCPRARTAMTPCVVADGDSARDNDGKCVGCWLTNIPELTPVDPAAQCVANRHEMLTSMSPDELVAFGGATELEEGAGQ